MSPVRRALLADSILLLRVQDGLAALASDHVASIDPGIRHDFADSLDTDAALKVDHPQDPRWDYLVGHAPSGTVLGIEAHSARDGEVVTVINKRKHALLQLRSHLVKSVQIAAWYWMASGRVDFLETERVGLRLAQNGIAFVGRRLLTKHLPMHAPRHTKARTRTR